MPKANPSSIHTKQRLLKICQIFIKLNCVNILLKPQFDLSRHYCECIKWSTQGLLQQSNPTSIHELQLLLNCINFERIGLFCQQSFPRQIYTKHTLLKMSNFDETQLCLQSNECSVHTKQTLFWMYHMWYNRTVSTVWTKFKSYKADFVSNVVDRTM